MLFTHLRRISTISSNRNKIYNKIISKSTDYIQENYVKVIKSANDYFHGPTASEVTKDINLEGKTCLITGGNSGIGLEVIRCLVSRNCNVLMACRNPYAAMSVTENMRESQRLRIFQTNLASFASVNTFCHKILQEQKKVDIVFLNAAVFGLPWTLTIDGLETIFQVNYLSQYYLLTKIEKILAPDARVIWMTSESHRNIKWTSENAVAPTEDLIMLPKHKYTSIRAYNVSKLCGLLAMHFLGYRWARSGKSIFCANPGTLIKTNLCRNWWPYEAFYTFMRPYSKPIAYAAATPVYCATSPELQGLSSMYFKDCRPHEESEIARDLHLAIRVNEITRSIIQDHAIGAGDIVDETLKFADDGKSTIEEPLISN